MYSTACAAAAHQIHGSLQWLSRPVPGAALQVWHGRWKGANVAVKVLKDMEEAGAIVAHTLKGLQAEAALMAQLHQ